MRALAWVVGAATAFFVVVQAVPAVQTWATVLAMAASFLAYAVALPVLWLLLLALRLRRSSDRLWGALGMIAAGLALVVLASPVVSNFGGASSAPTGDALRVMSLNAMFGKADAAQVLARAKADQADAVVLLEATPGLVGELAKVGFDKVYPHRIGTSDTTASGTLIYSRTPITEVARGRTIFTSIAGRIGKGATSWTVVGVHPVAPTFGVRAWVADAAAVRELVAPLRSSTTVVVGDFNAVPQHDTMRRLYGLGFADAVRQTGAGWQMTWPLGYPVPPLIDIDHALVGGGVVANAIDFFTVTGTDHRGLTVVASKNP